MVSGDSDAAPTMPSPPASATAAANAAVAIPGMPAS